MALKGTHISEDHKKQIREFWIEKRKEEGPGEYGEYLWNEVRNTYTEPYLAVWENHFKCKVPRGRVIHHLNEIKTDNRIENLVCWTKAEHARYHALNRSEESIERIRQTMIDKVQNDTEYMKKLSEASKRLWDDPDYIEKVSNGLKRAHEDEEYNKKISEGNKKKWADPEYKKKMSEMRKKKYESREAITCPYCGKQGKSTSFRHFHFDNCKKKGVI